MPRYFGALICSWLLCITFSTISCAADRYGLVIGNSAYQNVPQLANPTRDSNDVASALERLNFKVTRLNDANVAQMNEAVIEFGKQAEGARMAVIFYAGHGIEANGENWLIPVDAKLATQADAPSEAVSVRSLNAQVAKASQLGLIILDACRDNPFVQSLKNITVSMPPTAAEKSILANRSVSKGLAPTEPAGNVLIAFSAKDGTVASDGIGRNSPFTTSLLANIEIQGLEISALFRKVRDEVMRATKDEQQPYVYGSLSSDLIYFKPPDPENVKTFDGFWDAKISCDPVGQQLGWSDRFLSTVKNGVLVGQTGREGRPGSLTYNGFIDADGTIRVTATGLSGDPKHTIIATRPGTPVFWRAAGMLENSTGTVLRTSGRKCIFQFSKQLLGKPGSSAQKNR
ncbi:caspase family protein [Bradyrhizobium rifense]|nr:caspase family protein [Bradyrhizobium rifense]